MPILHFQFQISSYFSLADDVMSISCYVHISGKVFELAPLPGYFVDGYNRHPGKC